MNAEKKKATVTVAVYFTSGDNDYFKVNGGFHSMLEKRSGVRLNFVSYTNDIYDSDQFEEECADAKVIVSDAECDSREHSVLFSIKEMNPHVEIFTIFSKDNNLEGRIAESVRSCFDDKIVEAIKYHAGFIDRKNRVLLLCDEEEEYKYERAEKLLEDYDLTMVKKYDQAEELILKKKFDYVLLDFMVSSTEQRSFAEKKMPLAPTLALLALSKGIKKIGISYKSSDYDDVFCPFGSGSGGAFLVGNARVAISNKDCKELIEMIDAIEEKVV